MGGQLPASSMNISEGGLQRDGQLREVLRAPGSRVVGSPRDAGTTAPTPSAPWITSGPAIAERLRS